MRNDDATSLPQDPGPVPPAVVDAYVRMRDATDGSMPNDADVDAVASAEGDDESRLSTIEALLATAEGRVTLAHIAAARGAVTDAHARDVAPAQAAAIRALTPRAAAPLPVGRRESWRRYAAAACVMLASALVLRQFAARADDDGVRTAGNAITVIAHLGPVDAEASDLTWRPLSGSRYRLEVLDATGTPVFVRETNDTVVRVPAGMLMSATRYRWFVRAFRADGSEVRSAMQRLETR
jgi:hypothetical protein